MDLTAVLRAEEPAPTSYRPPSAGVAVSYKVGQRIDCGHEADVVERRLRDGWISRSRIMGDGRRQILELVLPGETLPARVSPRPDADIVVALSRCEVVSLPAPPLQDDPAGARARRTAEQRRRTAILNERIISLGQRSALERTAHLFCELAFRLGSDAPAESYDLPMTQGDLADYLGLSVVHMNRTMQALRHMSLTAARQKRLCILDFTALSRVAAFTPDYLEPLEPGAGDSPPRHRYG